MLFHTRSTCVDRMIEYSQIILSNNSDSSTIGSEWFCVFDNDGLF